MAPIPTVHIVVTTAPPGHCTCDRAVATAIERQADRIRETNRHLAYIASAQQGLAAAIAQEINARLGTVNTDQLATVVGKIQRSKAKR